MNRSKVVAALAAGAALLLWHTHAAAQEAKTVSLGVKIQVTPDGAEIIEMLAGRTAESVGFKVGDILLEAGGKPISPEVLTEYLKQAKEGDQVSFKVKRDGAVVDLTGSAVATPEETAAPAQDPQG